MMMMIIGCCVVDAAVTLVNLPCLATQSREMNPLFNGCFVTMQLRRKAAIMPLCRLVSALFARGRASVLYKLSRWRLSLYLQSVARETNYDE